MAGGQRISAWPRKDLWILERLSRWVESLRTLCRSTHLILELRSAPYLHDGRAQTLEQAIALHGGEALKVRSNYFKLKPEQRLQVKTFMKSLVAPE